MNSINQGKTNWNYIIIFAVIAIVLAAGILWYVKSDVGNPYVAAPTTSATQSGQNNSSAVSLSYANALKIYANRRIELSLGAPTYCVVFPPNAVFKNGTSIMLDNRSKNEVPISLDGQLYDLGAYSFKIVTLTTSASLPRTLTLDCGKGKNNGTIMLEQ